MTASAIAAMEDTRKILETYEFPSHLMFSPPNQNSAKSGNDDHSSSSLLILEEYKKARDLYLQRKLMQNAVQRVTTTYDVSTQALVNSNFDETSAEEKQELEERREHILTTLSNKALLLQQKQHELNTKYIHFQQRRDEFMQMMHLQQQPDYDSDVDNDDEDIEDNYDTTMEYENQVMLQEDKMSSLHERYAQLQVQLRNVQQQNTVAMQNVDRYKLQLRTIISNSTNKENGSHLATFGLSSDGVISDWLDNPDAKIQELYQQNIVAKDNLDKVKESHDFYLSLRHLLETLSGIRFKNFANKSSDDMDDDNGVMITVQLLDKYDVEIALEFPRGSIANSTIFKRDACVIQSAIIISDNAVVTSGAAVGSQDTASIPDSEAMVMQLRIPDFDDIVQFANTYSAGENIRTLLRELLARMAMIEERVKELTKLQQEKGVVLSIGPLCTTSAKTNNNDHGSTCTAMMRDQEVVCSLNHPPMTTVLRLTGNCPLMDGSIYIDQLIGLGGWDQQIVQQIQDTISTRQYQTPIQIVSAIQTEVQRLQDEEQFIVPSTPRMPLRFNFE
jgi:hypothetical protein